MVPLDTSRRGSDIRLAMMFMGRSTVAEFSDSPLTTQGRKSVATELA